MNQGYWYVDFIDDINKKDADIIRQFLGWKVKDILGSKELFHKFKLDELHNFDNKLDLLLEKYDDMLFIEACKSLIFLEFLDFLSRLDTYIEALNENNIYVGKPGDLELREFVKQSIDHGVFHVSMISYVGLGYLVELFLWNKKSVKNSFAKKFYKEFSKVIKNFESLIKKHGGQIISKIDESYQRNTNRG